MRVLKPIDLWRLAVAKIHDMTAPPDDECELPQPQMYVALHRTDPASVWHTATPTHPDGYARGHSGLLEDCPACARRARTHSGVVVRIVDPDAN